MQDKGPGSRLSSWTGVGVLGAEQGPRGAEQGSQEQTGVLAVDQGSHKHSRESCRCRAGFWGTNQGAEVSRAEVLGCSQGSQGWDVGPVQEFWEKAGWAKSPSAAQPHRAGGGRVGKGRRT